jgi:hypothetical protein
MQAYHAIVVQTEGRAEGILDLLLHCLFKAPGNRRANAMAFDRRVLLIMLGGNGSVSRRVMGLFAGDPAMSVPSVRVFILSILYHVRTCKKDNCNPKAKQ